MLGASITANKPQLTFTTAAEIFFIFFIFKIQSCENARRALKLKENIYTRANAARATNGN